MKTVVIASNNAHKAQEIAEALPFPGWEFKTLAQMGLVSDPVEDAPDFLGNARIKARAAWEVCAGYAVIADDSGLEVDALEGAPGVHSARYAGESSDDKRNNAKLLAELAAVPQERRQARFVCTLVYIDEEGKELTARGSIEGRIGFEAQGEEGFGYDPLFYPDELDGLSFAQVSAEKKNAISHRGRALQALKAQLV